MMLSDRLPRRWAVETWMSWTGTEPPSPSLEHPRVVHVTWHPTRRAATKAIRLPDHHAITPGGAVRFTQRIVPAALKLPAAGADPRIAAAIDTTSHPIERMATQ